MEFRVIIPARFDSSRLPGKVLMDIGGKPMIQHVYERAVDSGAETVVIATDDKRIAQAAEKFGAPVCMTSSDHESGTERLSEAVVALDYEPEELVVCVQADEPLIPSKTIRLVADDLAIHDNVRVVSICEPITDVEELFNPHVVKVALNRRHYAMYFSRAPIPYELATFENRKDITLEGHHYRHIGLYAYRVKYLEEFVEWGSCELESMESLEQLRLLWNSGRVHMSISKEKLPPGVDTEEDLKRVRAQVK